MKKVFLFAAAYVVSMTFLLCACCGADDSPSSDGMVVKSVVDLRKASDNLLKPVAWKDWGKGFVKQGDLFLCDNGDDAGVRRGTSQTVVVNQKTASPIVASVESKTEGVGGRRDGDYCLHVDIIYMDGTHLWSQKSFLNVGTHDWERREVAITPEKPVQSVIVHLLLQRHTGKAWFRNPRLYAQTSDKGVAVFDGQPVLRKVNPIEGFQVRDVKARSDFVRIESDAIGLQLRCEKTERNGAVFVDTWLKDTTGKDRAVTLYYAVPVSPKGLRWLPDPRLSGQTAVASGREYMVVSSLDAGMGKLSRYPLAAVANDTTGMCLAIDMDYPAFYRLEYSEGTGELFVAYDIGLIPENSEAHVRFCRFSFDPEWGFRAALARYYELFPDSFRCRTPEQGLWMPFAKVSEIKNWQDFGFKFKEGTNEIEWDDRHGITTFRYTETFSWWMEMPKEMPRTMKAAFAYVHKLASEGNKKAQALLTSGFHDEAGRSLAKFRNAPWCDGAVWSMNSIPGVKGAVTDFKIKWNQEEKERYHGDEKTGDLDGEYIDSSEGFVTGLLDFRRDHLAAAETPLTFSKDGCAPAQFCGLISFEYVRAIARDVHGMGKLMMANATPAHFCWLAPMMDVLGTETNWCVGEGVWRPMPDAEMLYRRALTRGKPYCFLMCSDFHKFNYEFAEKYMKRVLAYGMLPGFFSPEYSQRSHYFNQPEFYDRDRPLFKQYVPLCKLVAEAGWEPITLARSSNENVHVERFGTRYLTVFNDSTVPQNVTISLDRGLSSTSASRELLSGKKVVWDTRRRTRLKLSYEDVAVIDLGKR